MFKSHNYARIVCIFFAWFQPVHAFFEEEPKYIFVNYVQIGGSALFHKWYA